MVQCRVIRNQLPSAPKSKELSGSVQYKNRASTLPLPTLNGYQVYRSQKAKEIHFKIRCVSQGDISVITSEWWSKLSQKEKQSYNDKAIKLRWDYMKRLYGAGFISTHWHRGYKRQQRDQSIVQKSTERCLKSRTNAEYKENPSSSQSLVTKRRDITASTLCESKSQDATIANKAAAASSPFVAPSTKKQRNPPDRTSQNKRDKARFITVRTESPVHYHYCNTALSYSMPLQLPSYGRFYPETVLQK